MYIQKTVGQSGINIGKEVYFIQELLNIIADEDRRMPSITIDGKMGDKTKNAIGKFQQYYVKLKSPDSRIDPNGRSEKTLISTIIGIDQEIIPTLVIKYKLKKEKLAITGSGPRNINYRTHAKKNVSVYSENIIKLSMGYAKTGRGVEKVYFDNKSKSKDEIKNLMKEKIVESYNKGNMTSLHCVAEADYKKKNVLDIPFSSVSISKHKSFEQALMGMSAKVKNARYTQPKLGEIYISRLIIENKCWHIEIIQNNKILPNQKKPTAPTRKKQTGTSSIKVSRNYMFDFLDEWF